MSDMMRSCGEIYTYIQDAAHEGVLMVTEGDTLCGVDFGVLDSDIRRRWKCRSHGAMTSV